MTKSTNAAPVLNPPSPRARHLGLLVQKVAEQSEALAAVSHLVGRVDPSVQELNDVISTVDAAIAALETSLPAAMRSPKEPGAGWCD